MPLKASRQLAYRGNSLYVGVPKEIAKFLRWEAGDCLIVEVASTTSVRLRRVEVTDLRDTTIAPMNLSAPEPVTK